jgi:hypothetical protein
MYQTNAALIVLVIVVIITWNCLLCVARKLILWALVATMQVAGAMWVAARRRAPADVQRKLAYSARTRPSTLILGDSNALMIAEQNKSPHIGVVATMGKSIAGVSKLYRDPDTASMLNMIKHDQPDNIILMFGTVDVITCFYYKLWIDRACELAHRPHAYAKSYAMCTVSQYTSFIREVRKLSRVHITVVTPSYIPLSVDELRDGLQSRWLRGNRTDPAGRVIPEGELWPTTLDEYISLPFRTTLLDSIHAQLTTAVTLIANIHVVSLNPSTSDASGWVLPPFAPCRTKDVHLNPVTTYPLLVDMFNVPGLDIANFTPVLSLYS